MDISDPEHILGLYLDCFLDSSECTWGLMPEWAETVITGNTEEFLKILKKGDFLNTSPFPDDYLRWLFLKDPLPSMEGFHAQKERIGPKMFEPLLPRSKIN